jgi:hypothetical protein
VTAAALAARALELLGPNEGPIAVEAPRVPHLATAIAAVRRIATSDDVPSAAVVAFLGVPASPSDRQLTLSRLRDRLPEGAPVVLVDHNQPRTPWQRIVALVALLVAGLTPARARYSAAQELAARGFTIRTLRLAHGERIQFVSAVRT